MLMAAIVATYAAIMLADEYKKHLRPGERFYIVSVANTIDQVKIALQVVKDLINSSPILKPLIVRETAETLELSNGAVFKALAASSRSGRGWACLLLIFDEIAHAVDTEGGNAAGGSLYQTLPQYAGGESTELGSQPNDQPGVAGAGEAKRPGAVQY